ncbi:hypothetical protein E4O05_01575 [Treponema sp. OMZ 787]|uniref:hypothetical protein n=1 Tax=Treponema sp. OMZ 787 TaxID=2563669 RepID=UPI0020A443C8|nr:hypothetical protein [Treponema sp. OMZ 787]UTC62627.1 hypothetical protein E4O05_01575 [Treponema sp. OMZ 787]
MKFEDKRNDAVSFLKEKNYSVAIEENNIVFKDESKNTWIINFDKNDPTFIRIWYPNFFVIEDNDRNKILKLINDINYKIKIAKIIEVNSKLSVVIEAFFINDQEYKKHFKRYLSIIGAALFQFYQNNK